MTLQHLRSSTANKRPDPTAMADGQIALNTAAASPGLFYKDSAGNLVKAGPVHVGSTAPNVSPASGGTAGNSTGESWLDTSGSNPLLKVWNGSSWQTVQPVASGTVVSTADTGSVTSTMIANGTIVDADVNASAAIAGTKISPDFGSQNVTTTGTVTGASLNPTSSTVPTNGVYLPAANSVAISTGGSGRLFVDASGNVGVKVAAPSFVSGYTGLQADGGSNGSVIKLTNSTTGSTSTDGFDLILQQGGSEAYIWQRESAPLIFGTAATERMRLDSSGRLGIGTSNPNVRLEVSSGSTTVCRLFTSTTGSSNVLAINNNDNYNYGTIGVASGNGTASGDVFSLGYVASLGGTSTNVLNWTSQGRVGIGTTSPGAPLEVNGTVICGRTDGSAYIINRGGYSSSTVYAFWGNDTTGISNPAAGQLGFLASGSERARIDSSGRLLVGTSSSINNVYVGGASYQSPFQVIGNAAGYGNGLTSLNYSAGGYGATLTLGNSKSATVGVNGAVANGDDLGIINFVGNDGTNFRTGAYIIATADGTTGTADLPTRLTFWTTQDGLSSPAERMRIKNDGFVLINTTTAGSATGITLHPGGYIIAAPTYSLALSTSPRAMYMDSTGYFGYLSSTRNSKENIQLQCDVDWLYQLEPVTFNYKIKDRETGEYTGVEPDLQFGLIAEDVEAVCPDICFYDETENGKELRGIYYEKLITPMLKALQQANQRIEALEAEVAALKAQ